MTAFHILIPARLESTRLPEKALADLAGRPMIVRVVERAGQAGAQSVHVATDNERIAEAVRATGGNAVMTAADHDSGTSRLAEAAARLELDPDEIVVNVQGDEPLLPPACMRQVAELLQDDPEARIATLWMPLQDEREWRDPNVVKLVAASNGRALYFSRAAIPARRAGGWPQADARRHVGLYAYRVRALAEWSALPPSPLAELESLEQLRALQAGWPITCARAIKPIPPGVDTAEDLEAMRRRIAAEKVGG
ncbi:MAG: 3-deoxy-manno-octulosonate cytidylyltransferase [Wenzhouxiangellaceae bacterium]